MADFKPGQIVQVTKALKDKGPGSDRNLAKGMKFKIDWVRGGQVCADPVNPKDNDKGFYFKSEDLEPVEGKKASMKITASDRSALIKLASSLPKGDETRRAILAGLEFSKGADPEMVKELKVDENPKSKDQNKPDGWKTAAMEDWRVDYTTNLGNGAYVVITAESAAKAKAKAKTQIILAPGERITSLRVS